MPCDLEVPVYKSCFVQSALAVPTLARFLGVYAYLWRDFGPYLADPLHIQSHCGQQDPEETSKGLDANLGNRYLLVD